MNKQTCKRHLLHRRTERRSRGIGVSTCGFWDMRADRQADVKTDGLIIGGGKTSSSDSVIMLLIAVHSSKRKATIMCPSVCLSHILMIMRLWLMSSVPCRPAYVSALLSAGRYTWQRHKATRGKNRNPQTVHTMNCKRFAPLTSM